MLHSAVLFVLTLLPCGLAPFAAGAQDTVFVAPDSEGTIYPANFYANPLPSKAPPYPTDNLRNHDQRALYERWNAWLSTPDRPAYLLGDEPFRMGLQVTQIDYKNIARRTAEKQEPPMNTGGIGKVGKNNPNHQTKGPQKQDKAASKAAVKPGTKPNTAAADAAGAPARPAQPGGSAGGLGSVGGVGKVGTGGR